MAVDEGGEEGGFVPERERLLTELGRNWEKAVLVEMGDDGGLVFVKTFGVNSQGEKVFLTLVLPTKSLPPEKGFELRRVFEPETDPTENKLAEKVTIEREEAGKETEGLISKAVRELGGADLTYTVPPEGGVLTSDWLGACATCLNERGEKRHQTQVGVVPGIPEDGREKKWSLEEAVGRISRVVDLFGWKGVVSVAGGDALVLGLREVANERENVDGTVPAVELVRLFLTGQVPSVAAATG